MKMSKSIPDSAIFMTDSEQEVQRKINKAYCPERQVEQNPVLEYCKFIVFERNKKMKIERESKFGGNVEFASFQQLQDAFATGELHPMDLKKATAFYLNELLLPVGKYFSKGKPAQLLQQIEKMQVTR